MTIKNTFLMMLIFRTTGGHFRDIAVLQVSGGTTNVPKLIPRQMQTIFMMQQLFQRCAHAGRYRISGGNPASHNFSFANPGIMEQCCTAEKLLWRAAAALMKFWN